MPQENSTNLYTLHLACSLGLEQLLATEAEQLGCQDTRPRLGRVTCQADLASAYKLVIWSRLASRVYLELATAKISDAASLNAWLSQLDWSQHLAADGSLFVEVQGTTPQLRNTHDTALRVKDAVVDYFSEHTGQRPSVEKQRPDVRLHLRMEKFHTAVLSLDLGGQSLHQRGYRLEAGAAPLRENLAAGMLIRAGWPQMCAAEPSTPLLDPFCGSGTLLAEAALMALDIAPALLRPWHGLESWRGHDASLWQELMQEAEQRRAATAEFKLNIQGSDQHLGSIQKAHNNLARAGLTGRVQLSTRALKDLPAAEELFSASSFPKSNATHLGLVITNPPYGERLDNLPKLAGLYAHFGQLLRHNFAGWKLAMITNNQELAFRLRIKSYKNYPMQNGPLECRLYLFAVPEAALENMDSQKAAAATDFEKTNSEKLASEKNVHNIEPQLSAGGQMFANRLKKNQRQLRRWLQRENISCYRLYDADMPEYAFALDVYGDRVHLQEYAAPATIKANQAQKRFMEALEAVPVALNIAPEKIYLKTRRRQEGKKQYEKQATKDEFFPVNEGPIQALVNLSDYLDTGLFLDHRPMRLRLGAEAKNKRFLNLYSYTGVATLHAAQGGARQTTSVDLSNTYLNWLEDNLRLNKFDLKAHQLVQADVRQWLENMQGGTKGYDLIFMDPPSFSNSKQMRGTLDVQRDHAELIQLAMGLLNPGGTLYFSTNLRGFKIDPSLQELVQIKDITASTLDPDFQRNKKIHQCFKVQAL